MINNVKIVATGNVVNDPVYFEEKENQRSMVSFRFASTPSRFDKEVEEWIDDETTWFDVSAYGALADNVHQSVTKGQPLVISGVLRTRAWENADGIPNTSNLIKAVVIGHNLTQGSAEFTRKKISDDDAVTSFDTVEEDARVKNKK
ncbi:MAG: single-stranded DNA-binding protein [Candidatus Ancillula sp.]|jgi:single-strand DNA-binding protein|nr:single-stranded DNA-binding protein [Candidatus Ancillula sp.]